MRTLSSQALWASLKYASNTKVKNMKSKIIAYYSIFIGVSVMALWIMILLNQNLSEGKLELSFHLFSEFLMALICLVSGIIILRKKTIGKLINILGLGMVIYSVLNAAGYYGEKNDYSMMTMFIILFILTSTAILLHFTKRRDRNKKPE